MPMKNPPHPGEHVADNLMELNYTVAEAAKALGVTRQHLHNLVNGKVGISPEMAVRLEKAIGGTARHWLSLQMNYDLAQVVQRAEAIEVAVMKPRERTLQHRRGRPAA